jgi:hypothetical protein
MSGKQKALLVVLGLLLVALFAVAAGGRNGESVDPTARNGLVEWLAGIGGKRGAVDPSTVRADCPPSDGGYSFTGSCVLHVADPGELRTLVLRSPVAFVVTAPAPGDADFTVSDDIEPSGVDGAIAKVAVDSETDVRLDCPGGGTCTVTVAAE